VFTLRIAGSGETCEGWDLAASERLNASRAGSDRERLNEVLRERAVTQPAAVSHM
jgi:hypothetical protein